MSKNRGARRALAGIALLPLLPLAAACGSSDEAETPDATAPAATSAVATPTEEATTEPAVAAGDDAYCTAMDEGFTALGDLDATLGDSEAATEGLATLASMRDAAPDEVKEDWTSFIDFVTAVSEDDMEKVAETGDAAIAAIESIGEHAATACDMDLP